MVVGQQQEKKDCIRILNEMQPRGDWIAGANPSSPAILVALSLPASGGVHRNARPVGWEHFR